MKRSFLLLLLLLLIPACSPADEGAEDRTTSTVAASTTSEVVDSTTTAPPGTTTTEAESSFPVTVSDDLGEVTIEAMPVSIVSLSPTATEMLFAIDAGDQVVAVDDQSNYPGEAPITDLAAFTPNVEAILGYVPDLVVIAFDPGELIAGLNAAGVPVLMLGPAAGLDDSYRHFEVLGTATGHTDDAKAVVDQIDADLDQIAAETPELPEGTTYYHEVDNTFYTATSSTFIGQIYAKFDIENIADPADADGAAFGFPQLSSEYIVSADPDLIFLANTLYGESAETVSARPGWDVMTAVQGGHIVELDSDIVSRWGPRIVDFAKTISDALTEYVNEG